MSETASIKSQNNKYGIIEGVIWKQLLLFFFPMLIGSFFQQLYNTADAVVVGQFVGKEALSAVGGTTGTIINVLVGFFIAMSSGATVIISQYYGARKEEDVGNAVHTSLALAIVGGAIIMVVGLIVAPFALRAMNTPEDIMPYSLTYIRIYFYGLIPNLVYNIGAGILRAIGDSKRPLYFLIISCFVNIALDLFFVVTLKMGVAGAATATIISQLLSAILVCLSLSRSLDSYQLKVINIRFHKKILKRIFSIGLPAGFQTLMYTSSNIIIQSFINGYGTDTVAAWTSYAKIDIFFWMVISSFGISLTTFVGQNYGAGLKARIRKGVRTCLVIASGTTILISIILYFFGIYLLYLFTKDSDVIEKGMIILRYLVPTYITYVCIEIYSSSLRGMGSTLIPLIMTGIGVCVLRVVWLFTAVPINPDFRTILFSYPLTWAATSIMFIIYYQIFVRKQKIY
ncbi:MAG: MATE family efflux transporter [Clostridiales bacterium GWF2_38_85]|nr:MAG: MATE family efflux transporter [Clostridiales bacterium GWF2_38_85]HBL85081.1 MATE family efflux transporter [Clostridiales bacterium]